MKTYIIGNWKCHKTSGDGLAWLTEFTGLYQGRDEVEVVVTPNFLSLEKLSLAVSEMGTPPLSLGAQDVSPFPRGSYTGAVAADMLKPFVNYVIVGHSERRRYFHETPQDVVNKVAEVADCGLIPIVCLEDTDILSQLRALDDIDCKEMLVAYTPVDSMNFSIPESVERISQAVTRIRSFFPKWPIIYGGAVTEDNAKEYIEIPGLQGLFLGETSLAAEKFAAVCNMV